MQVRGVGHDPQKHHDAIAKLKQMLCSPDNPTGLLEGSIEEIVDGSKLNKDLASKMIFRQEKLWAATKKELLQESSSFSKRTQWPIAELTDNVRSLQTGNVIETERDRLRKDMDKLVSQILQLK